MVQLSAPVSRLHLVPARPGHLRGREQELDQLDALLAGGTAAITPALTGQGGVGKTQLAALYAHDRGGRFEGGVFWLTLATPTRDAIIRQLVTFARACGISPEETGSDERQDGAMAERWLGTYGSRPDVLLILDNLEQPKLVNEHLPGLANHHLRDLRCRKLITSRRDDFDGCALLRLESLPAETARAVLVEAADRSAGAAERDPGLDQLLRLLGGLPLALRLAGALLSKRPTTSYARLVEVLRGRGAREILDASGVGIADYRNGLSASLGAMLAETWDALPNDRPELPRVVKALAQLDEGQTFPAELIRVLVALPEDPLGLDEDPLPGILQALQSWNLIERPTSDRVRLHPIIRDDTLRRCGPDFLPGLIGQTARRLEDAHILLAVRADHFAEIGCSLETLSKSEDGSEAAEALADLCRLLRIEGHALSLTADPVSRTAHPAQLAYAAALHSRAALKAGAEEAAAAKRASYFRLCWTTAQIGRSVRHRLRGHEALVYDCAISADGSTGLSASADRTLIVWDLARGEQRQRLYGHEGEVCRCTISADGSTGLSASRDRTLIVWDLAGGEQRQRLYSHELECRACAISADGRTGLLAWEEHLIVWDLTSGKERHRLRGHDDRVWGCAISADGSTGLSVSADQTLIVWNLASGEQRHRLRGHDDRLYGCAISADGSTGLSASRDRTLIVWDLAHGQQRHRLHGHGSWVDGCAISADGRTGLSASNDQTLIVWDLARGEQRHRLRGHDDGVCGCAISADGRIGLSASGDQTLILWDLASGEQRHRPRGHELEVRGCAISADGRTGLSASADQTLIVWNLANGEERHRLRGHEAAVMGCAVSADGSTGLSGSADERSHDQTLIVWDLASGEQRQRLRGHDDEVYACAISADGSTGLSASRDQTLIVWDLASGAARHRLRGHEDLVYRCAISADGSTGLSGSHDQTLIVWDLASGEQRLRMRSHGGVVCGCAINADGSTGLLASLDRTVTLWDLTTGKAVSHVCLESTALAVAWSPTNAALVGARGGNVTCFEVLLKG